MVFIFDLGTVGDGSANSTYYFDDVSQSTVTGGGTGGTLTQMNLPVTFDSATVDYGLIGFGGAEASTIVVDPTLATNKVVKVIKSATAELWAGTTVTAAAGLGFSSPIPFTASATKMNVRVWSPTAGIKVRLKVEDHNDNTHTVETEATVTTASGWQTLEFNFANQATGTAALNLAFVYDKASIFFNFGVTGATAGEKTYYFDDVAFGAAPTTGTGTAPTLPMDFESSTIAYSFIDFDGGTATKVANPQSTGINTSATVAKMVKGAGQPWAGSKIVMASPVDFTTKKLFKVKVWSPVAGKKLLLKFEGAGAAFEKESVGVTAANTWQELSFDFTGVAGVNNLNNTIVFIFDLGTAGDGSANSTYYFDDVSQTTAPVVVAAPLVAAPTPPARLAADVKSLFSGAYAEIAGTEWNANWGQSTVSEAVSIEGNATRKYSNLNYIGVVPAAAMDATGMTHLHLDIWTPDCTAFEVFIINPGPVEQKVTLTPTLLGWNSFDISLADYSNIAMNNVAQFKFVSPNQNSTVYMDNMYFYRPAVVGPITTAPTNLSYGGNLRFQINKDVFSVTPTVTANPVPTFSITPAVPTGMSFDTVTGSIVGTPTVEKGPVSYTVTAKNSIGSQSITFTIEIFNNDHDFDGIDDAVDNCPEFYNPNQEDKDKDGIGDICTQEKEVKVAQGFSPNGDGINDTWYIKNIENHQNSHVRVFNKMGAEVFVSRDYNNQWDGTYKNTGEIVAAGSYFYQVDLGGDGSIDLQGWIYIAN